MIGYILAGVAGGVLGGMGMGGGFILVPLLRLLGVSQQGAQGIVLAAWLPMALLAAKTQGSARQLRGGNMPSVPHACLGAAAGSLLAVVLPSAVLRRIFGCFLIFMALIRFTKAVGK
ncbi:MAG: TSUP family transporter [Christensenellaceae bacterium]